MNEHDAVEFYEDLKFDISNFFMDWFDEGEVLDVEARMKQLPNLPIPAEQVRKLEADYQRYAFLFTATHFVIDHPEYRPMKDFISDLLIRVRKRGLVPNPENPDCLGDYLQPVELQKEWEDYRDSHDIPEPIQDLFDAFVSYNLYPVYE